MGLRPVAARWFEALAARDDLSQLAEALARSGVVQIEAEEAAEELPPSHELGGKLGEYEQLARRYHPYWPETRGAGSPGDPGVVLERALARIREWSLDATPHVESLERAQHERADLVLLRELLAASGDDFPPLDQLRAAGPTLVARLYALPPGAADELALPGRHLARRVVASDRAFVLVVGTKSAQAQVEQALAKARPLDLPAWLSGAPGEAIARIDRRLDDLTNEERASRGALEEVATKHRLPDALADVDRLRWFSSTVPHLPQTRHFAVVTGWTSDRTGATLRAALEASGVRSLVDFPPPPEGRDPPVVLENTRWVRPFEMFAGLLGTPGSDETDPSAILAVIAPVLFGFMFGDVGQGLVLVAVGLSLRNRMPVLRLLVPGGVAAIAFGVLFGSVFARDDLLRPLWANPLGQPLQVLGASVLCGALVLLLGLGLGGLEAWWRGAGLRWLRTDAAIVAIYVGLLGTWLDGRAGLLACAGVVWHVVGSASVAREKRWVAGLSSLGHLVERVLQLLVNTVSFARVGAFALAHAGLCSAVAALAAAAGHPVGVLVVLVVGNVFTIVLEGLVVSIQTTRLVLFEFFVRFLTGEGRAFRPLPPPPLHPTQGAPGP